MKTVARFASATVLLVLVSFLGLDLNVHAEDANTPEALRDGNFKIAPPYADAPEMKVKDGVPKGKVHDFTMDSKDSKFYPGIKGPYQRKVQVYIPANYEAGKALPFLVVHDGPGYTGLVSKVLDNMIHDKRLPAMAAIFIASGGGDGKGSERGLEYDTLSEKLAMFIETEVLPRVEKDYKVTLTKDPEGRATMGCSSGAAAAFTMAWYRPDLYHKVLSYSGTFVDQQSPADPKTPHGAWEYHENLIAKSDAKPIRVWLEVGEKDIGATREEKTFHNWVLANQRMAEVLKAKNYHYRFVFAGDSTHCDRKVANQTLPDALSWLWQGYTAK
jgi:iron(III)-enterobactin esterase